LKTGSSGVILLCMYFSFRGTHAGRSLGQGVISPRRHQVPRRALLSPTLPSALAAVAADPATECGLGWRAARAGMVGSSSCSVQGGALVPVEAEISSRRCHSMDGVKMLSQRVAVVVTPNLDLDVSQAPPISIFAALGRLRWRIDPALSSPSPCWPHPLGHW
jgi:hypothetical protein